MGARRATAARPAPLMPLAAALLALASGPATVLAQPASDYLGRGFPYATFDALPKAGVGVQGGTIDVAFAPGEIDLPREDWLDWVGKSADAIVTYYGRYPVASVRLLFVPTGGSGMRGGQAFGYRGPAIRLAVGKASAADDMAQDWRLVHEMVHLALPDMPRRFNWLSEGLAVYVESIARVQAGHLPAEQIWRDFVRDMPKGLPADGDRGLDNTPSWGRTYWGGAMFCLLADIEIRQRTGGRSGLQDALRAIVNEGGNIAVEWPIERVIAVGDAATGTTVLADLYEKLRDAPVSPDLDALWRRLGVIPKGATVVFDDDDAELAAVRRAITAAPAAPPPSAG